MEHISQSQNTILTNNEELENNIIETRHELSELDPDGKIKELYLQIQKLTESVRELDPKSYVKSIYHHLALLERGLKTKQVVDPAEPNGWEMPKDLDYWGEKLFDGILDIIEKYPDAEDRYVITGEGYHLADNMKVEQLNIITHYFEERGYELTQNHEDFIINSI